MSPSASSSIGKLVSLPILDLESVLLDDHATCIQTIGNQGDRKRCSLHINKDDRTKITELVEALNAQPSLDSHTRTLLADLASLCHCNRHHRKNTNQVEQTRALWLNAYRKTLESVSVTNRRASQGTRDCPTIVPLPKNEANALQERRPVSATPKYPTSTSSIRRISQPQAQPHDVSSVLREKQSYTATDHGRPNSSPAFTRRVITRSNTQQLTETQSDVLVLIEHKYLPYSTTTVSCDKVDSEILGLIRRPLLKTDENSGYVYVYKRNGDLPNHFKIGFTTQPVRSRLRGWESSCKYEPLLVFSTSLVPHARRVEQLALTELAMARKKESACRTNPLGCGKQHKEWVNTDLETVKNVVRRWARWIEMEPYADNGNLEDPWVGYADLDFVQAARRGENKHDDRWNEWIDSLPLPVASSDEEEIEPESFPELRGSIELGDVPSFGGHQSRRHSRPAASITPIVSQRQINDALEVLRRAGIFTPEAGTMAPRTTPIPSTTHNFSIGLGGCGRVTTFPKPPRQATAVLV